MKKIEELEKFEGNGKVILLNTDNGHWARMSKEWYNRSIQTVEEKEKFGQMLEERFTKDFRGHWNIRNQHRKYF